MESKIKEISAFVYYTDKRGKTQSISFSASTVEELAKRAKEVEQEIIKLTE